MACVSRPVTRRFAKEQGIQVSQDIFAYPPNTKLRPAKPVSVNVEATTHTDTSTVTVPPVPAPRPTPKPPTPTPRQSYQMPAPPMPAPRKVSSTGQGPVRTLVETQLRKTGGKNVMPISQNTLVPEHKPPDPSELFEVHTPPEKPMYRDPQPLFSMVTPTQISHGNVPKQQQIDLLLDQIRLKCLRDYNIPLKAAEIKQELRSSPYFKSIYQYLTTGLLPSGAKAARSVLRAAEQFILVQGVLFKIAFPQGSLKLSLCIPESQIQYILSVYHDSLLSCHQGVSRTFSTIRSKFFIPGLYDKLVSYIRSCTICQQRKQPQARDNTPPLHPRIFEDYVPFSELHIDLKQMFPSTEGFQYLLVMACVQTRFVIALPIRKMDSLTVAEAVLQRVVFVFGLPRKIVSDQGSAFSSKVFQYILKTLQIDSQFVSPYNHGSLVCERSIGSLSRLLLSQLEGHGRNWPLYVNATCYSYNSFCHSLLGNYSPYELAFGRPPPDYLNVKFPHNQSLPVTHQEYIERLKMRFDSIGSMVISMQNANQEKQAIEHSQKQRKSTPYVEGQLVYLLMPQASSLQTNTRKFVIHYVGPLKIKTMLDNSHCILEDLNGAQIYGVHNVRRLKHSFIRTDDGNISLFESLRQKLGSTTKADQTFSIVNGDGTPHDPPEKAHLVYKCNDSNVQVATALLSQENSTPLSAYNHEENNGIACPHVLSDEQQCHIFACLNHFPNENEEVQVSKIKIVNGSTHVLFVSKDGQFSSWYDLSIYPQLAKQFLPMQDQHMVQGSFAKFARSIYV